MSEALQSANYYLNSAQRRAAGVQLGLLLVSSVLDVFGLAALVPILLVAAEPGGIERSRLFAPLYHALPFESERAFLAAIVGAMFLFFVLKNLFSTWVNYLQARFTARVGLTIIGRQLDKFLNLPFWYFSDYGSANLINSAVQVPLNFVNLVLRPLFVLVSETVVIAIIVVAISLYKPQLIAVLALVLAPATLLTYRGLRKRSQHIGNELARLWPRSYHTAHDLFAGFTELKLAAREPDFVKRLMEIQRETQSLDAESYLYALLPVRIIEMVAIMGVLIIFLYSLFGPAAGRGGLIALVGMFAAAAYRLMPSVNRLLMSLVQMKQGQYTMENVAMFRGPEFDETPPAAQLPLVFERELAFDHVSFSFPKQDGPPALNDVSLRVRRGEKVGFVGSSGSGKTTLMNVLLRFYREQQGRVLVDGQPLTPQHLRAWYRLIGYVKQDTFLMDATIQDNITLGEPVAEVDAERLRYAVEQASLAGFVDGLPEGLATMIGERGSKLSGGQRQRIGIARALYKRAEILVLDEATSALDNETEREVSEAITRLAHTDITILIIAHRLTTLRECGRIYELSHGQVVAERTYAELVH